MDQKIVSGLGNIYVNEILNLSSVNPKKLNKYSLYKKVVEKNFPCTCKVISSSSRSKQRTFSSRHYFPFVSYPA